MAAPSANISLQFMHKFTTLTHIDKLFTSSWASVSVFLKKTTKKKHQDHLSLSNQYTRDDCPIAFTEGTSRKIFIFPIHMTYKEVASNTVQRLPCQYWNSFSGNRHTCEIDIFNCTYFQVYFQANKHLLKIVLYNINTILECLSFMF